MKRILKWVGIVLGVLVLAVGGGIFWLGSQLPERGPVRVDAGNGIVGVRDTKSYTWILRTAHGAALVDAGSDPKGEAALAELKAQGLTPADVHTIVLTHGHKDHWAAAALFPNAKVRVGADDVAMVKGDRKYQPALIDKLTNAPAEQPRALEALGEDETLSLDGLAVRAVHVRGHTLGSMVYVVNGLCFTGDSLFRHADHVAEGPRLFSEEPDRIRGSLQDKLVPLGCERFADGHAGLTEGAGPKLTAFLAAR